MQTSADPKAAAAAKAAAVGKAAAAAKAPAQAKAAAQAATVRDSCRFCIMRQLTLSRVFRLRASATMPKRCSRNGTAVM